MVETLTDIPEVEGSSYVKWVRGLEEKIGEGRFRGGYYEAKEAIPACSPRTSGYVLSSDFAWLTSQLIDGMRSEIASCASSAYPSSTLSLKDATTLMFLSPKESNRVIEISSRMDWQVDPTSGMIKWSSENEEEAKKGRGELKKEDVLGEMLSWARELERII